jgi:hypothetical protein
MTVKFTVVLAVAVALLAVTVNGKVPDGVPLLRRFPPPQLTSESNITNPPSNNANRNRAALPLLPRKVNPANPKNGSSTA